jgi:hypothetical protein
MNVTKTGWGDMEWIKMAQGIEHERALVNTAINLRVP